MNDIRRIPESGSIAGFGTSGRIFERLFQQKIYIIQVQHMPYVAKVTIYTVENRFLSSYASNGCVLILSSYRKYSY